MAQRYGGKYSPQGRSETGSTTPVRRQVSPVGLRANLMFLPPLLVLATSLWGGAISLVTGLGAAAVLTLGAWILRGGLEAQAAYDARKVSRRPAFPRKIFAAVFAGAGIGLAALSHDNGLMAAILFGLATAALHLAAFGIDPLQNKGMDGVNAFQQTRVARVVDEAEDYMRAMRDAIKRAGDRQAEAKVEAFQSAVRDLIHTVEEDPRDLTAARKYLGVYLLGARDATEKFADVYARTRDEQARKDYMTLLDDLSGNFSARTRKLMLEDRSDLTIEIDVLRDRLAREGVRLQDTQ